MIQVQTGTGIGTAYKRTRTSHRYPHRTNEFNKNLVLLVFFYFFCVVNHHELKLIELIKFIFPVLANYYNDANTREGKRQKESARMYALFKLVLSFVILYSWWQLYERTHSHNWITVQIIGQYWNPCDIIMGQRLIQFYVMQTKKWPNTVIMVLTSLPPLLIYITNRSQHK